MSSTSSSRMSSKVRRILKRIGIGLGIAVILLVVAGEVLLQTGALTGIVTRYASEYVDGELAVGRVSGSLLSRFPKVRLCLEDVRVTYPHDRFLYAHGCEPVKRYAREGRGEAVDTLLSLHSLDATVSWIDAIGGAITLPEVLLDGPRFFYHDYGKGGTNLDVFGSSSEDETPPEEEPAEEAAGLEDEDSFSLPLTLGRISITGHPHVVYTAAEDDIYVAADFSRMEASTAEDGLLTLNIDGDADLRAAGYDLLKARLEAEATTFHRYDLGDEQLPVFAASLELPRSGIFHQGMSRPGRLRLGLEAKQGDGGLRLTLNDLRLRADGLRTALSGGAEDLLGEDPLLRLDGDLDARLDSLGYLIPKGMDLDARGGVTLYLKASSRLSALDAVRYPEARIEANLHVSDLDLQDRSDSLFVRVPGGDFDIRTQANRFDDSIPEGTQVLGVRADLDSLLLRYGSDMAVRGQQLMLAAQNSTLRYGDDGPMGTFTPFMVFLKARRLGYRDGDSFMVGLGETRNAFRVASDSVDRQIPRIELKSSSGMIFLREDVSRYGIRNASLSASAKLNAFEKVRRRNAFRDSLQRQYPGVPRDSMRARMRREMPEWLRTEEFRDADIDIELDETLMAYLRDWDLNGTARIGGGRMITPLFPLATHLDTLSADFTFDRVDLYEASVRAGESQLALNGSLSGIRRALNRRGPYVLDLHVESEALNADEIMSALAAGEQSDLDALRGSVDALGVSDEQYEQLVELDSLVHGVPTVNLFVVPANLIARADLLGSNIRYGDLDISWISSDIRLEQRILQVTNTVARSNMGDVYLDTFYATQSMEDIGAGLNLSFVGIDAGKVAGLYPGLFDDVPYVNNVSGNVECQFAALSRFDTQMDLVLPSLSGVARITGGEDNAAEDARRKLVLKNDRDLRRITRLLLFRHPSETRIHELDASLLMNAGQLEILPFILGIDRYRLAIAGLQGVDPDQAFQYSVSVIRSPLLIPFGINLSGPDFDHLDWHLTRAKYRGSSSLPKLASREKVEEAQARLADAIYYVFETGVAGAMKAGFPVDPIEQSKAAEGYRFELETEELSEEDTALLRAMQENSSEETAEEYVTRVLLELREKLMSPEETPEVPETPTPSHE